MTLPYLLCRGLLWTILATSSSLSAFMELRGGRMNARSTTAGTPSASSTDTSASPVPSAWSVSSVSKAGFTRNDLAAARSAFWSLGV